MPECDWEAICLEGFECSIYKCGCERCLHIRKTTVHRAGSTERPPANPTLAPGSYTTQPGAHEGLIATARPSGGLELNTMGDDGTGDLYNATPQLGYAAPSSGNQAAEIGGGEVAESGAQEVYEFDQVGQGYQQPSSMPQGNAQGSTNQTYYNK